MNGASFDVAVVGTGVVGLAAALGCAQQGLRTALVGPRPRRLAATDDAPFDPRIYALAPAAVDLLARLKAWPAIAPERVQAVARMRVFGDTGGELTFDAYQAALPRLATIVEEGELVRALGDACSYAAQIERLESTFDGVTRDPDGTLLRLADGRELRARLLLGADGAASAVRAALGITADEVPYHQAALVANFCSEQPHHGVAFQWFAAEGVVALLPLPRQHVSLVWSAPQALADELAGLDAAALAARLGRWAQPYLGALEARGSVQRFALRRLAVAHLIGSRCALLGDAAHVVHPLAGQGLNLGLADVSEMLRVLAAREPFRDPGDAVLLRRYERARAEPVGLMRVTTDGLARLFARDDALTRDVRNLGLAALNRLTPLKNALVRHAAL